MYVVPILPLFEMGQIFLKISTVLSAQESFYRNLNISVKLKNKQIEKMFWQIMFFHLWLQQKL